MTAWTSDELDKIGKAEELQIASLRRDGNSIVSPEARSATIKLVPH
jgi:hypothetical protein